MYARPDGPTLDQEGFTLTDLLNQIKGIVNLGLPDAVWVRAEISELRSGRKGHLDLHLNERSDRGDVLAKTTAIIWGNQATGIGS